MKIGKLLLFLCFLILTGTMTACGEKAVSENQILYDIRTYREFAPLNVEVTDWEIIKRQTNYEDKTDYVYCIAYGKNDDYSVVRNYKLKYVLYNDGWILEEIENYQNPDAPTETIPLHGVSYEQVKKDFLVVDFMRFASFENVENYDIMNSGVIQNENSYYDINDFGWCVCETVIEYTTPVFIETAVIPIEYFFTQQEDGSYGWNCQIEYKEIQRDLKIKDEKSAKYVLNISWASGEIEVTPIDAENIYVKFYQYKPKVLVGEGISKLWWPIDDDGKISNVSFTIPNTGNAYAVYDGENLIVVHDATYSQTYYRE